jgi:tetratricopeptide (TPR) repeat protein
LYDKSLKYHYKSLAIHEKLQKEEEMAADYRYLGVVFNAGGSPEEGLKYFEKTLEIDQVLNAGVRFLAIDYRNLGAAYSNQGNYEQGLIYARKALEIYEKLKDKVEMARGYSNIGTVLASIRNRKTEAIESYSKGLKILQELEEQTGYHHPLNDEIQQDLSKLQKRMWLLGWFLGK